MRIVVVQRSAHACETLRAPHGAASLPWSSVVESLDRHDIPDGLPSIVVDDGSLTGCDRLNTYLLTAWRQRAYDLDSLRSFHAYHLARLVIERRGPSQYVAQMPSARTPTGARVIDRCTRRCFNHAILLISTSCFERTGRSSAFSSRSSTASGVRCRKCPK